MAAVLRRAASTLSGGRLDTVELVWEDLTFDQLAGLVAVMTARGLKPRTVNLTVAAVRGVIDVARKQGRISRERAEAMKEALEPQPVDRSEPAGRHVEQIEVARLFEAAQDGTRRGSRDVALLALLFGGGLRRSEAAALLVSDYDSGRRAVRVLLAKGRKRRTVFLPESAGAALDDWLATSLPRASAGAQDLLVQEVSRLPLLCQARKGFGALLRDVPLTGSGIGQALSRLQRRAGVAPFGAHSCRRTYVGALLDAGADITGVQRLVGHSDVSTTGRYSRLGERAAKKAAALGSVPYVRSTPS